MKAVLQKEYGPPSEVLLVGEVPRPEPGPGEVLVRVRAAAVAGDDWHLLRGEPYVARLELGLTRPKRRTPGTDLAGVVVSVGEGVHELEPGDQVFGWAGGAFAEYVVVPVDQLVAKPAAVSFEQAAAVVTTGSTALQAVRDRGEVTAGRSVLIIGASGGVGLFAVQIARRLGARVTAVCSTRNVELVRALGADRVVDYTKEDFAASGERHDAIVYLAGNRSISDCRRVLTPQGILVLVGGAGGRWLGGVRRWLGALAMSPFVSQKLRPLVHRKNRADLQVLAELMAEGHLRPVVEATYPLEEVLDALGHSEAGHGRGKVVLQVPAGDDE